MRKGDRRGFWEKVDVRGEDECWPWQGYRKPGGYGQFGHAHRGAHRVAYELGTGPIPEDLQVLHSCDNPPCCNPAHLFVGTARDNVLDMRAKGRAAPYHLNLVRRGAAHPRAILSDSEVAEIRRLYSTGDWTQREIASVFGVGQTHVSRLVRGEQRVEKAALA